MLIDTTDLDQMLAPGYELKLGTVFKGTIFPAKPWEWCISGSDLTIATKHGIKTLYLSMQLRLHRGALAWFQHHVDGLTKAEAQNIGGDLDPVWMQGEPLAAVRKMKVPFAKYEQIENLASYFQKTLP
jgi:hypothetical protein